MRTCAGSSMAMLVAAQSRNRCGLIGWPKAAAVRPTIAAFSSASEKKRRWRRRARIQRSTVRTATSTFALSRGLRTRVGRIVDPVSKLVMTKRISRLFVVA